MGSKEVYSEDWWAVHRDENRCVAHRKNGEQCLKAAIRGGNVCRFHGGAAGHVRRKARERLELAADRMARELLGMATGAESEAVKLNAIRDALDRAGLGAKAEVTLELKPYELLLQDISGLATVPRDAHLDEQGRQPYIIDVDEVEPDTRSLSEQQNDATPWPSLDDPPALASAPTGDQLMTAEDAVERPYVPRWRR